MLAEIGCFEEGYDAVEGLPSSPCIYLVPALRRPPASSDKVIIHVHWKNPRYYCKKLQLHHRDLDAGSSVQAGRVPILI